jgi:hypothetical protein
MGNSSPELALKGPADTARIGFRTFAPGRVPISSPFRARRLFRLTQGNPGLSSLAPSPSGRTLRVRGRMTEAKHILEICYRCRLYDFLRARAQLESQFRRADRLGAGRSPPHFRHYDSSSEIPSGAAARAPSRSTGSVFPGPERKWSDWDVNQNFEQPQPRQFFQSSGFP